MSVLLNTTAPGATTLSFAAQQTFATGYGPSAVVAADVNGDGLPDIIVLNSFSATVSVLLNAPAVLGSNPATGTIDSAPWCHRSSWRTPVPALLPRSISRSPSVRRSTA